MRWVSHGSIGLIAFMGCTGPVVAQQTQSCPKPKRGATRTLLLASTALATGVFAGAMVNPQTAQAACVTPRTTTTTTTITPTTPPGFPPPPPPSTSSSTSTFETQKYLFFNGPSSTT